MINNIDKIMETSEKIYNDATSFKDLIERQCKTEGFSNIEKALLSMYIGFLNRINKKFDVLYLSRL